MGSLASSVHGYARQTQDADITVEPFPYKERLFAMRFPADEYYADEVMIREFAEPLIRGALEHREESDVFIRKYCKNWDLPRIAAVDRNILRLAIYEMLHREDIPPVVSINEVVDIAKRFSTEDSGRFVNGILDSVKKELMRPAREV